MTCDSAVRQFLTERKGCQRDITKATGYAKTSVNKILLKLRDLDSPLAANITNGRVGGYRLKLEPKVKPPKAVFVAASNATSRMALEEVWR